MKKFNPERFNAHLQEFHPWDGYSKKMIRFEISKEEFQNLSLGERIFVNHRQLAPAFFLVSGLYAENGQYEVACRHEFDAIGYKPKRLDEIWKNGRIQIGEVEIGDIVTVMGKRHVVEDLNSFCIRIKPL